MVRGKTTITSPEGIQITKASQFSSLMKQYPCQVTLQSGSYTCDGKSLMSILNMSLISGESIEIICDGEKEQEALSAALNLLHKE